MKTNYIEENQDVDVSVLTEREISSLVFKDAGVNELRGLSNVFSESQIQKLCDNENAGHYRWDAMDMLAADEET